MSTLALGDEVYSHGAVWAPGLPLGAVTKDPQLINCTPVPQCPSWTGIRSGRSSRDKARTLWALAVFTDRLVGDHSLKLTHPQVWAFFCKGTWAFVELLPALAPAQARSRQTRQLLHGLPGKVLPLEVVSVGSGVLKPRLGGFGMGGGFLSCCGPISTLLDSSQPSPLKALQWGPGGPFPCPPVLRADAFRTSPSQMKPWVYPVGPLPCSTLGGPRTIG